MSWDALLDHLVFASDATIAGIWAAAFAVLAVFASIAERRRVKRKQIEKVGYMPWTGLSMLALFISAALGLLAIKGWAGG